MYNNHAHVCAWCRFQISREIGMTLEEIGLDHITAFWVDGAAAAAMKEWIPALDSPWGESTKWWLCYEKSPIRKKSGRSSFDWICHITYFNLFFKSNSYILLRQWHLYCWRFIWDLKNFWRFWAFSSKN